MTYVLSILLSIVLSFNNGPEELGMVNWIRDYDQALEMSEKLDKPVFILFQEVPGCATCKNYGNNVLSHPFIVEAIEDEFIPLVVYNNKGGADGKVLRKYNEPSWNNPVVRIVDAKGENIVRRLYGNYSQIGVIEKIIEALLNSNKLVPDYLYLFAEELQTKQGLLKESYVSMYCFWTGEKVIGDIQGVVETEAGFMDGKEVVRFKYNPSMVSYDDVLKKAGKAKCADSAYTDDLQEQKIASRITKQASKSTTTYRKDKEVKYYLSNTVYQYLPLSNYQAQKMNVALGKGQLVDDYLSPRQKKLLEHIQQNSKKYEEKAYLEDFEEKWWEMFNNV